MDYRPTNYSQMLNLIAAVAGRPLPYSDLQLIAASIWTAKQRPRLGADWSVYIGPAVAESVRRLDTVRGLAHATAPR